MSVADTHTVVGKQRRQFWEVQTMPKLRDDANPLRNSDQLHGINLSNPTGANGKRQKFVCVTGYSVNRRLRRGYDEIQRFYHCSWPDCNKTY